MKGLKTLGIYNSPTIEVLKLQEDVVRTSGGAQITWNDTDWGDCADFLTGGDF